jgi:hypothetical protein
MSLLWEVTNNLYVACALDKKARYTRLIIDLRYELVYGGGTRI